MDWQPIETAPMDGTAIWLLIDGRPYIGLGEPKNAWRKKDRWFAKATVRRRSDAADEIIGCSVADVAPTHWMPLPEPPTGDVK